MKRIGEAFSALVTALRTLTILPVPGREAESMASALFWFPVVGLILGFIVYGLAGAVDYAAFHKWP